MTTLIVKLPLQMATTATEFAYVLSADRVTVDRNAKAPATLLPHHNGSGDDVVAVVPARALSWHQVELPQGVSPASPRLRAVLEGLLEERLLDEPDTLHFALEPVSDQGLPFWVAVCDRAWLRASLAVLEAAQVHVSRIVPEFTPGNALTPPTAIYLTGEPDEADLVIPDESGVTILPVTTGALALARNLGNLPAEAEVIAEPAVLDLAEKLMGRRATLQTGAERAVRASQSPWDLAQFEFANSGSKRALKRLATGWIEFLHSPRWRAARWGITVLIAANLIGINAWAWREKTALNTKREAIRSVLTQTFPGVQVVVDAPVQMEREMGLLRRSGGDASNRDLEVMLGALGNAAPINRSLSGIEFMTGEARFKGLALSAEEASAVATKLQMQGLAGRAEGETWVMKPGSSP
ncbi:MAG: putative ral secretion pathway protein component of type secretion system [Pseudomonadota bacterium]|jgi:general secretion pathway protein L